MILSTGIRKEDIVGADNERVRTRTPMKHRASAQIAGNIIPGATKDGGTNGIIPINPVVPRSQVDQIVR